METFIAAVISTGITVFAVVWANGRSAGKVQEWMRGHEKLDQVRFDNVSEDVRAIKKHLMGG